MLDLSTAAIIEKNKMATDSVFVVLIEVYFQNHTLRICSNNEDVIWRDYRWYAFPFELDNFTESKKGEIPQINLKVGNQSRAVQNYVEFYNGGVGAFVYVYVINTNNISDTKPEIELPFMVTGTSCNSSNVTFNLGVKNIYTKRCPNTKILRDFCRWEYKDPDCQATSSLPSCDKSFAQCKQRNNTRRFGGFPGVGEEGILI